MAEYGFCEQLLPEYFAWRQDTPRDHQNIRIRVKFLKHMGSPLNQTPRANLMVKGKSIGKFQRLRLVLVLRLLEATIGKGVWFND